MNFLISIFGALLGILIAVGIIILIVYCKIKSVVGTANMGSLKKAISNAKDLEREEYSREKSVKGMTRLLEEEILRDFPDFNKDLIFSICESNLIKIFNALESKDISEITNDDNFTY